MRATVGGLVAGVVRMGLLGCAVLYAARWLDFANTWVAALQAIVPIAGAGILTASAVAALLRRRRTALAGALASVCVLAVSAPSLWAVVHRPDASPRAGDLVVLSSNLQLGGADPRRIAATVDELDVDVLVLLEVTPEAEAALAAQGLRRRLPHAVGAAEPGASGTLVWSRHPLTPLPLPASSVRDLGQPAATVQTPAGPVTLRAVHPLPPTLPGPWHASLTELGQWARSQPSGIPLVLAGDANATSDHPVLRAAAAGLVDAHAATGTGWPTWPVGRTRLPPFAQIDHVLVRGCTPVAAGTGQLPGTDHAYAWARLRLG